MEQYHMPSFELLTHDQQKVVLDLMEHMMQAHFSQALLNTPTENQNAVNSIASVCKNNEDLQRLMNFIEQNVYWYRLPGFWLSFYLQLYTQTQTNWLNHVRACIIHSDAQLNLNYDLAFDSTEVAYHTVLQVKEALALNPTPADEEWVRAVQSLENLLISRLKFFYAFYSKWYKSIDPSMFNPITDNLYYFRTNEILRSAYPELDFTKNNRIPSLQLAIEQSGSGDRIYLRVVARRCLANMYLMHKPPEAKQAIEQLTVGLEEINKSGLEAEAGHFHRLLAWAFINVGDLINAAIHFDKAYSLDANLLTSYWRCLSARELASLAWKGPMMFGVKMPKLSVDSTDFLKISSEFYRQGRLLFDWHMNLSSELPLSMAVKQQMFRCYTENAIEECLLSKNQPDILEEMEANSPREISQIVAENLAAQKLPMEGIKELRKNREVFHRHLTTVPESFDEYLATFEEQYKPRHAYLKLAKSLSESIEFSPTCNVTVNRVLQMRIPNTKFLIFNTGRMSYYALVNIADGSVECDRWLVPENALSIIHQQYSDLMNKAALETDDILREQLSKQAVNFLLKEYQEKFGPTLQRILPEIEKENLKIFPRLQMNAVPLHALKINDRYMIETCDVSYNQNLNLFLNLHKEDTKGKTPNPPLVVFNQEGTKGFLQATIKEIEQFHKTKPTVLQNPSWKNTLDGVKNSSATDILFACHGIYDPHNPASSHLELSNTDSVAFTNIFADLDLSRYRSVVLGACESGIVKAELASEYLGLPTAFLAAGVRYFVGSLWEVSEFSTSILLGKYFKLLNSGNRTPPQALSEAQRQLMHMSRDAVWDWVKKNLPHQADDLKSDIDGLEETPFVHPYFWAAFYVSGDI